MKMESKRRIEVPLRLGGKKIRKRRELDALIVHSLNKKHANPRKGSFGGGATLSQDKLLSASTDEDYAVWTNSSRSERRRKRKYNYFQMCAPLLYIFATVLLIGIMYWLYFDLRNQIYNYRQKMEEVSATTKNLPDILQEWHETSSNIKRNQSAILTKINGLQKSMDNLIANLTYLETSVNTQQSYGKDEKLVADFGAKIEAVITDVETMKEHYNAYIEVKNKMEMEMNVLKTNITGLAQSRPNLEPANFSNVINDVKLSLTENIKGLYSDISLINDTLTQKTNMLQEEQLAHKNKLDDLLDRSENITSHVTTISNNCADYKQKITNLESSLDKFENEIKTSNIAYKELDLTLKSLETCCQNKMKSMEVIKSNFKDVTAPLLSEPQLEVNIPNSKDSVMNTP